jgi:peptide/nickel transport system substrate-binding protein
MYGFLKMDKLVSIDTPDNYTVIMRYSEPFPASLGFLAWYGTFILPEHIFNKTDYKDWMDPSIPALAKPVGTGPFRFVEYVKGDHVTLEANPDYFKGRPCIDRVVFKIVPDATAALQSFIAGEGDWLTNPPPPSEIPRINSTPGLIVNMRPVPSRWYIAFNLLNPMLSNLNMRLAIAHAINTSEIVEKALNGYGYPARGMYTPVISWAFNPNASLPTYDPMKAEKILNQLGFRKGSDGYYYYPNGTRLSLRFTVFQGAQTEAIAVVIKEQLRRVGIDIKIEVFEIYLPIVDLVIFFIYRTEWHGFHWHMPGLVGLNVLERVWWEKGVPAQIQTTPPTKTTPAQTTYPIPSPTATATPQPSAGLPLPLVAAFVVALIVIVALAALRRRGRSFGSS